MNRYRIDLHTHTVLSPCGSLDMSPQRIVDTAVQRKLDAIGIADHNSMRQCKVIQQLGQEQGLTVFCGVEITTSEEAHCLAFFEKPDEQDEFQDYLDLHLPNIKNRPDKFGYQVWVNRFEEIEGEEDRLLISALSVSIDDIAAKVKSLNGIFIAAHIDRPSFSLISQLGFIDNHLPLDAIEVSFNARLEELLQDNPSLLNYTIISASDAHVPELIGLSPSLMEASALTFSELVLALHHQQGRSIKPEKLRHTI